jgi:hypothetical protein
LILDPGTPELPNTCILAELKSFAMSVRPV